VTHDPAFARRLALIALCFVVIFWLCVLTVHFAPEGSDVAVWWPAGGLGSAMVLLSPPRYWAALLAGIVVVTGMANVVAGRDLDVGLLFGVSNASESLVLVALLGVRRHGRPLLRAPEDLPRLLLAIAAGAASSGTCAGTLVAVRLDGDFVETWTNVTAAHGAASLLIVPLALFVGDPWASLTEGTRTIQVIQVVSTLVAFAAIHHTSQSLPLSFLPLPLLVWGAQVLSPRALAAEALAAGLLVTALTAQGGGPFGTGADLTNSARAALIQLDLVVIALVSLPLALNVSQRRAALREAVAVGETYRRSLTESVIGTMLLRPADDGLKVLDLNEPAGDLLGVHRDDLLGRHWAETLGPHSGVVVDAAREMLHGQRTSWERELALDTEPVRCVRVALSWVPDTSSGDLIVAHLVDLTEHRAAQRALEQERDFNAALLAATTGTSIIATDRHGLIAYVNRGAERLLGYQRSDLVARHHLVDLYDPEELRARADEMEHGAPTSGDWTHVGADGRRLLMSVNVTPMRDAGGRLLGYLQVSEDVTERAQAQEALRDALGKERQAVDELERLDRSKSEFLATVSHELRTPMTSIMGVNDLLSTEVVGPVNDRQRELLRRGSRAGQRLLGLIENTLTLSRVESLTDDTHHAVVDLRDIVTRTVETAEPLCRPGVSIVVDQPDGPTARVMGDANQLERALVNVVANALKFTLGGGVVRVTVQGDPPEEPGRAVVTVEDSGIGIPTDEQSHLFERFFRASSAVQASIPGSGLGLAIVRSIVEAHRGEVTVTSRPGEGTVVRISLPLLDQD
jgi:PAS domain S-box-containing protein